MTDTLLKSSAKLLTIRQVAILCGVTSRTVFRWLEAGILPREIRIGKGPNPPIRFRRADIEAWLAAGCPQRGQS